MGWAVQTSLYSFPPLTFWPCSYSYPRAYHMTAVYFLYRVVWPWPMTPPQLFRMGKGVLYIQANSEWQQPVSKMFHLELEHLWEVAVSVSGGPFFLIACGSSLMGFLPAGSTQLLITSLPTGCSLSLHSPHIFRLPCLPIRYVHAQKVQWFSLSLCFR